MQVNAMVQRLDFFVKIWPQPYAQNQNCTLLWGVVVGVGICMALRLHARARRAVRGWRERVDARAAGGRLPR